MRTVFRPLFRVRLRHSFYASGRSRGDFLAAPAAATRRALARHGLIFRPLADGWAVYAEIEPDSSPERLLRPLGADGLRLTFLLLPANPHLWNISELPEYRPSRSVFYFNNLRDDQDGGRLYLGDSVAGERLGEALPLVAGGIYTHRFAAPVEAASVTLADLFGNPVATISFALPPGTSTSEYRLDLTAAGRLAPGRYSASDDHGGSAVFYYDSEIFAGRPFGAVEIFSRTDTLTPDASDLVPAAYRYLDGDQLSGVDYSLQLERRSTTWRYHVVKKYSVDGFALEDLEITGDVAFDPPSVDSERAVFTSTAAVPLAESRRDLALTTTTSPPEKIRDLPNPAAATPLAAEGSPPGFVSEIYVYV